MDLVETDVSDQLRCPLELLLGLAAEPHDQIGGERDVGDSVADARDLVTVLRVGVPATHVGEDLIVACLEWQVDVFADLVEVRDGVDDAVAHVVGVRTSGT